MVNVSTVINDNEPYEFPVTDEKADEALWEIIERYRAGDFDIDSYARELRKFIRQHQNFIDGYAHLGYALFDQGKYKAALTACLKGISIGESFIPASVPLKREWKYLNNRPFLRALHGAAIRVRTY